MRRISSGGATPSIGGRDSAADAAVLIRRVGGTAAEARILGAISQPESGGNPRAHNRNARTGDNSYGLWQINMLGRMGPQRRRRFGISSNADLLNPEVNARIALKMHRMARGYRDWGAFRSGLHRRYLAGARARGGPVHTGQSYVVGEQGWEIYRPSKSGQIVNQKQLAAEGRNAWGGAAARQHHYQSRRHSRQQSA
ncbi:MAG: transglycosylase SLT domain-containing protein [Methylocystis sp.]